MIRREYWHKGEFPRPHDGLSFTGSCQISGNELSSEAAWRSHGGFDPANANGLQSRTLRIQLGSSPLEIRRVVFYGLFAIEDNEDANPTSEVGAMVQIRNHEQSLYQLELISGRHFLDSKRLDFDRIAIGDGTELVKVGTITIKGITYRVDRFSVEFSSPIFASEIRFQAQQRISNFVIFDCFAESIPAPGCPFHSHQGGISLSEIPSIVRVGEVHRWEMAMSQLSDALIRATDLDEARSQALTFIAVLTAAALEKGADRSMHRVQLDTARLLDQQRTVEQVLEVATEVIDRIAKPLFGEVKSPSAHLVQKSLAFVERNFARNLDDSMIADHLGLSTSHFRFLFREATGQPFHRYLISMRLEQARRLLAEGTTQVSEVANAVGFRNSSHFSRAFSQRFGMSPVEVRRQTANT